MKRTIILLSILAMACGDDDSNDIQQDDGELDCEYTTTEIGWDEEAPNGVIPRDYVEPFTDPITQTFRGPANEGEVEGSYSIHPRTEETVYYRVSPHNETADERNACPSGVYLPLRFTVTTADLEFDEEFEGYGQETNDYIAIRHDFDLDEIQGSFDSPPDESDRETFLHMNLSISASETGIDGGGIRAVYEVDEIDRTTTNTKVIWQW